MSFGPLNHLSVCLQLPRPCYDVMQKSEVPSLFHATCILPHLALQITPGDIIDPSHAAEMQAGRMHVTSQCLMPV